MIFYALSTKTTELNTAFLSFFVQNEGNSRSLCITHKTAGVFTEYMTKRLKMTCMISVNVRFYVLIRPSDRPKFIA